MLTSRPTASVEKKRTFGGSEDRPIRVDAITLRPRKQATVDALADHLRQIDGVPEMQLP